MCLAAVGDASYSLYLTHPFVLRPLRNIWIWLDGGSLPLSLYVIVCISSPPPQPSCAVG